MVLVEGGVVRLLSFGGLSSDQNHDQLVALVDGHISQIGILQIVELELDVLDPVVGFYCLYFGQLVPNDLL